MLETDIPYEYEFKGGVRNTYGFSTDAGIGYEISFVPSSYLFDDYPQIDMEVFEMVISIVERPGGVKLPADPLVSPTIFAIFEDFFLPQLQAIVYICDSSDGRANARQRKFSVWFYNQTQSTDLLAKLDRAIPDNARVIYLSLIMSRLHPQFKEVIDIFAKLGEEDKGVLPLAI